MQIGPVKAEDWLCKVTDQRENQVQHMKLHDFSYIMQSKLQHILNWVVTVPSEILEGMFFFSTVMLTNVTLVVV